VRSGIFPLHVWFVHVTIFAVKSVINERISSHWNRECFHNFTTVFTFTLHQKQKQWTNETQQN